MKWGMLDHVAGLMLLFVFALVVKGASDLVGDRWGFLFAIGLVALIWLWINMREREAQEEQHLREQQRGYYGDDL